MGNEEIQSDQGSRPMPEFVKRGLIRVQGGGLYLKAQYRVLWMREEHPSWSIVTSIEFADWDKGFAVVRAVIMDDDGRILATAHAEEARSRLPFLRKAETAALSRALALCGYGTQFGEINEEEFEGNATADPMAERSTSAPTGRGSLGAGEPGMLAGTVNNASGPCPSCKAPASKKHGTSCKG